MDVHDGFIMGIYNYCDRWCETCAFTSRCRLFADRAEFEASDVPPPPPRWLQECIDEMNEAAREPMTSQSLEQLLPRVAPEHQAIENRARAYAFRIANWLQTIDAPPDRDHADPRSVIGRYCAFIPAKIRRALTGLNSSRDDGDDWSADHDGSAKVALLAIDQSRAAWIQIVDRGLASVTDVEPFVSGLGRLVDDLDRVFPKARAFVRPGFDEPDEVAKLV